MNRAPGTKGFNKDRFEVEQLSRNYINSKRIVREAQNDVRRYSKIRLETHMKVICRIEYAVESLDEDDRFIIENEVLLGKKGKWFLGYFSSSCYYKHRKKAYANFLRCL